MAQMDEKRIKLTSMYMLMFCCFFIMGGSLVGVIESYGVTFSYTLNIICSLLLVMIPVICFLLVNRRLGTGNIRHGAVRFSDILIIFLFYLTAVPAGVFLNLLSQLFVTNVAVSDIGMLVTEVPFIPAMILTALIPAIQEELMCRGIIYESFKKADPLAALFISALFFGMMHGNLNQMIYATYLGFVMALVFEATGSIYGAMVFHFFVNASSTVIIYLQPLVLKLAKFSYAILFSSGMKEEAEFIRQAYGGSFEMGDYLKMASSAPKEMVSAMLLPQFFKAVLFGVGAFFIYRWLAKRNNRWEDVKGIFRRSEKAGFRKLCPPTLITAFAVMLMNLILDTLIRSGIFS